MKWHWLVVLLMVGVVLMGCEQKKALPPVKTVKVEATPEEALQAVDKAIADLEKALQGSDLEAVRGAAQVLNEKLGSLASHVSQMDTEKQQEAHKAGKPIPPALMDKLAPAISASDEMMTALIPPKNDVAKAKQVLPTIKSAVDAVRSALK